VLVLLLPLMQLRLITGCDVVQRHAQSIVPQRDHAHEVHRPSELNALHEEASECPWMQRILCSISASKRQPNRPSALLVALLPGCSNTGLLKTLRRFSLQVCYIFSPPDCRQLLACGRACSGTTDTRHHVVQFSHIVRGSRACILGLAASARP
jgi:hypothetical protein